jgi:uncharacterized protein YegJ (DUF2314 family)
MKLKNTVSIFLLTMLPVIGASACPADERSELQTTADDQPPMSIMLLQSAKPAIDDFQLSGMIEKAWQKKLSIVPAKSESDSAQPDSGADHIQKTETGFLIRTKQARVTITTAAKPYVSADDIQTVEDLRCRKMLQDHRAWISVDTASEDTIADAIKLAAEMINQDTLGIMLPSEEILLPRSANLQTLMRGKDPIAALRAAAGMTVLRSADNDPRMKAAVTEARKTWPDFVKAFESKPENSESFAVRFPFKSGTEQEFMWVEVISISKDSIRGKLANEPVWSKDLKLGDDVTRKVSELTDWLYLNDGQIVGGFTVKVLTKQQEEPEK